MILLAFKTRMTKKTKSVNRLRESKLRFLPLRNLKNWTDKIKAPDKSMEYATNISVLIHHTTAHFTQFM